jgi:MFS family permease
MLGIIIRVATLIPLHLDSFERDIQTSQPWGKVLGSKQTLLFLIPWVLISLNNGVLIFFDHNLPSSPEFAEILTMGSYIMFIGISVFGLISGFMADRSGRKQPLILGAMALGISYALVGISTTPFNLMLMMILSGAGWGFVTVILQWVVFGDLAPKGSEEKYYVLALVVYPVFEAFFRFLEGILRVAISPSLIASVVSMVMFVSVLPLLFVPETLPDKMIKDRRFKEYLKKVIELVEESNES